MTTTVSYPSEVVPGPPPIHLEMPQGWTHVWAPDTLVAIRADAADGHHFFANLVVRHVQRVPPFGREEIHGELGEYVRHRTSGELGPLAVRTVGDREFHGADLTFDDAEAGTVGQTHWFTVLRHHDLLEVIQVTGSHAADRRESDRATVDRIIDSIRINR